MQSYNFKMSFTNNKVEIFDHLGGGTQMHMHPKESLVLYDGGSCVLLWEILEDIKVRVHEHNNPVKVVKFFGEDHRFIFSSDYRTIIISEWHSLKRVAELSIPLKRGDSPFGDMMMDYHENQMFIVTQLKTSYRVTLLSFKEFSLQFVFSADMTDGTRPVLAQFIELDHSMPILVVEDSCVKIWDLEEDHFVARLNVGIHKPILSAVYFESKNELALLLEEGLVLTLNKRLEFANKVQLQEPEITKMVMWSEDCLCLFSKESKLYTYDWIHKKTSSEVYLRDRVDVYSIDNFGDLENKVADGEYQVLEAYTHRKTNI